LADSYLYSILVILIRYVYLYLRKTFLIFGPKQIFNRLNIFEKDVTFVLLHTTVEP